MNHQYYSIGRILSVALILILETHSVQSLSCYYCAGCSGTPIGTSSGSICLTYNLTCVGNSKFVTSLGLAATSKKTLCSATITPYTTTIGGTTMVCNGRYSCCYTDYCNTCPSVGCVYTSTGTGGRRRSSSSNSTNMLRMSIFGLPLVIILFSIFI